ncbi:MAG: conjugal transfer protein TraN [Alphaproteobacteria bacterium]|nr:conjugal transfer protein TraN [Alphaproteobacteria bacterium]
MMHLFFFLFCPFFIYADALSEGESIALSANQKSSDIKKGGAGQLEMPLSERPKECGYYDAETLNKQAEAQKTSEDFVYIKDSYNKMEEEIVEPYDPFQGNQTIQTRNQKNSVEKVCIEGGEPYSYSCARHLKLDLVLIPQVLKKQGYCRNHGWVDEAGFIPSYCKLSRSMARADQTQIVEHQSRRVDLLKESWIGCDDVNGFLAGSHQDVSVKEIDCESGKAERRVFRVRSADGLKEEDETIERSTWEKKYTYMFESKICSTCNVLRREGCSFKEALCLQYVTLPGGAKKCFKWKKVFSCGTGRSDQEDISVLASANQIKPITATPNQNMYKALAQLEGLKQVAQHMDGSPIASIFKGDDARCSYNKLGIEWKNCCDGNGGLGTKIGISTDCSADEKTLRKARDDKRCIYLGKRDKKKVAGVVVAKEDVFCCFPSKIARAIQEGARRQLGLNFGSADAPNCRGLTPGELERVDFGNLDLSDAFSDIALSATKMTRELKRDFEKKKTSINTKETQENFKHQQQTKGAINGQSF